MSLIDEALAYQPRKGPDCTVCKFLARLDDDLRPQVEELLAARDVMGTAIEAKLAELGQRPPKAYSINRHRRGDCRGDLR